MSKKVHFTKHATDRFVERFGNKIIDGNIFKSLTNEFHQAVPNKTFKNNTEFVTYLYGRYGYESEFDFRTTEDVVFVCRDNRLITVFGRHEDNTFAVNASRFRSSKVGIRK